MTTRAQPRYASVEDAAIAAGGTMQTGDAPTTASHADAGRTDAVSALPPVVSRWLAHAPVVLALLACSTALSGPFLSWDDALYVTGNPRVQDTSWSGLVTLWSPEAALAGRFIEFFPLRDTLYWVLWALFGQNAVAFHALVVVLHAVATWRVAVLAQRMFSPRVAWTAAALFAVLPVHVESVAWIAALKDPLYTTCLLLAVEAHVQFRSTDRTRYLVASLVAVALGFLVKSLILVAPGVLLLVDWYLRVPWRKTLAVLVPHALVCALFLVPILAIAKANDVIATYPGGTLATGLMTTVLSYAIYLEKLCAPVGLNAWYVVAPVLTPTDGRFLLACGVLAAVTALAAARAWRGDRIHLFALAWWAGALVPVVNFVPHRIEVADRYQYAPSIAFCLWAAVMLERIAVLRVRAFVGVAVTSTFLVLSALQALVWADEEQLWRQVLEQPGADTRAQPLVALGNELERRGRDDEALQAYLQATRATDALARPFAHAALLLAKQGRVDEADRLAREAVARNSAADEAWHAKAAVAEARGDRFAVVAASAQLAMLAPDDGVRAWNHAVALWRAGAHDSAARRFGDAVRLDASLCERLGAFTAAQRERAPAGAQLLGDVLAGSCAPATSTSAR